MGDTTFIKLFASIFCGIGIIIFSFCVIHTIIVSDYATLTITVEETDTDYSVYKSSIKITTNEDSQRKYTIRFKTRADDIEYIIPCDSYTVQDYKISEKKEEQK